MKIGHFVRALWKNGGLSAYVRRIAAAQSAMGHDVIFLDRTRAPNSNTGQTEQPQYVPDDVSLFSTARAAHLDILHLHGEIAQVPPPDLAVIRTPHTHQPYCPTGGRFLERRQCACPRRYSLLGCLYGHLIDGCGSRRPRNILYNFQATWGEMRVLRKVPSIAISHYVKEQMVRSGYDPALIHVLHHPGPDIPQATTPPPPDTARFLFLGRIAPQKGLPWLLEALALCPQDLLVDVAGEGHKLEECRQTCAILGLTGRVTFHGWQAPAGVFALLQSCRALVFPSLWPEPFGLVALDAMAAGRAVIAGRSGGIPEIVQEGRSGLLVNPGDAPALAQAMQQLAQQPALATQFGYEGRRILENDFSMEKHMDGLMALYAQVMG